MLSPQAYLSPCLLSGNGSNALDLQEANPAGDRTVHFYTSKPFWLFKEPYKTHLAVNQLEKDQPDLQSFQAGV